MKDDPSKIIGKWLRYLWLRLSAAAEVVVAAHNRGQNLTLTFAAAQRVDHEMPLGVLRRIVHREILIHPV